MAIYSVDVRQFMDWREFLVCNSRTPYSIAWSYRYRIAVYMTSDDPADRWLAYRALSSGSVRWRTDTDRNLLFSATALLLLQLLLLY